MKKDEALFLVGSRVSAWTAANGTYVGQLVEILTEKGRPWRGKVTIEGVLAVACHFEIGRGVMRRGIRPGEEIEVGGSSIRPCETVGVSYREALETSLEMQLAWYERDPNSQYAGTHKMTAEALQEVLRCELARLESCEWQLNKLALGATA